MYAYSKKYVVGLTGGIGCGKSTVAQAFRDLGVEVICADAIARELVEQGHPNLAKIAEHFGDDIIQNGKLNRGKLQERIFLNPQDKIWLEALLHPQIRSVIRERIAESKLGSGSHAYVIVDIPLLLESEPNSLLDEILVVDCTPEQQRERTRLRDNLPLETINRIIAQQVSQVERIRRADQIIDNSGTKQQTLEQVKKLHHWYLLKSPG